MAESNVPVLIIGGGPVGLSASLLLSRHGVRSLLVERHPGTSIHPKARGLNVRTLELFRVWGVEPAVRTAAHELDRARDVAWAPTLLSPETKRAPYGARARCSKRTVRRPARVAPRINSSPSYWRRPGPMALPTSGSDKRLSNSYSTTMS
jgi:2-polyprenyl-6-methoxyphenol hydroxylase-like FAD-dependent oxidoreductase